MTVSPAALPSQTDRGGASRHPQALDTVLRLAALVALVLGLQALADPMVDHLREGMDGAATSAGPDPVMLLTVLAYALLMALPFVPGIELGLAILLAFGPASILPVYLCTQAALLLSYAAGRLLSRRRSTAWPGRWWLPTAGRDGHPGATPEGHGGPLALPLALRRPWLQRLARNRYLALAILINLPGNAVLGGAGGIALAAGMSRAFRLPCYLLAVALATAPVPVGFWICAGV